VVKCVRQNWENYRILDQKTQYFVVFDMQRKIHFFVLKKSKLIAEEFMVPVFLPSQELNTDVPIIISPGLNNSSWPCAHFVLLKVMRKIIEKLEIDNSNKIISLI